MTNDAACSLSRYSGRIGLADPAPPAWAEAGVRARLWLTGGQLGQHDDQTRLWLLLRDGRALAFRLPYVAPGDDAVIAPLAACVADDLAGRLWEIEHPAFRWAQVLYAAPVAPRVLADHGGFMFDGDSWRYFSGLDAETMRLLLWLEREPAPAAITRRDGDTPHPLPRRFYASVRNYNRLAALPAPLRERRLQALFRFPALVPPLLLTTHHSPNLFDGKRHAWREKNATMEAAIDQGRDLAGALARHYGVSRGFVRSPLAAAPWPAPNHATRLAWLRVMDALPDNQRPSLAEFDRWQVYLGNYHGLLGEDAEGEPQPPAVHRGAFRLGWTRTWETAARRYGDLHPALADCRDFLGAAREGAAVFLQGRREPSLVRLAGAWLACHGLLGLLAASARWHRPGPSVDWRGYGETASLPALLGCVEDAGRRAEELLSPRALVREGEEMRHCVGRYWPNCLAGDRIFALRLADGERATAQYGLQGRENDPFDFEFRRRQLRGLHNREVSGAMVAWADAIEARLNAPETRRRLLDMPDAGEQSEIVEIRPGGLLTARFDAKTLRQLHQALAWLGYIV